MRAVTTADDADSDDALVARALAGERNAFQLLYIRYAPRLATLLASRFSGLHEDLLQEAFLKAWCNLNQYQGGNFGAWVYRIAQNRGVDELRRARSQPFTEFDDSGTGPEKEPFAIISRLEEEKLKLTPEARLQHCLEMLDERTRSLIVSRFGGEEDHPAVCARLGITEKRGYKLRHYALKQLRRCVERRGQ